jgi:hypothetical protein
MYLFICCTASDATGLLNLQSLSKGQQFNNHTNNHLIMINTTKKTRLDLATQEGEIRRIMVQSQPSKQFARPYLSKIHHKKGLVERLKV